MKCYKLESVIGLTSLQQIKSIEPNIDFPNEFYIYDSMPAFIFFKDGVRHNEKSAAFLIQSNKQYWLNGIYYGSESEFKTDEEWQKFVKLKMFL